MTQNKRIGTKQLFAVFFICRELGVFTFSAPLGNILSSGDELILFIPFIALEMLAALPVFYIIRHYQSLPDLANGISKPFCRGMGLLYFSAFSFSAALSLSKFELFMSTAMYPDDNLTVFVLLLLFSGIVVASGGLQTVARSSGIVFCFTFISVIAVMGANIGYFDILNLSRPLENGVFPLLQNAVLSCARTPELATLLFLAPEVKHIRYKSYCLWSALFGVSASAVLGFIAGVTGKFGETQMFHLYTLTQIAQFGVFERLDSLLTGVWVLCALFRTAFYLYTACRCFNQCFQTECKLLPLTLSSALQFAFYLLFSADNSQLSRVFQSGLLPALFTLTVILIPMTTVGISRLQKKQIKRKKACA